MAPKPCKKCGGPTPKAPYCSPCKARIEKGRTLARGRRDEYAGGWRYQSQQLRQQWIQQHGFYCPGFTLDKWHKAPHPATDLVVDHDIGILCRSCNGSKAATYDKQRAQQRHPTNHKPPATPGEQ